MSDPMGKVPAITRASTLDLARQEFRWNHKKATWALHKISVTFWPETQQLRLSSCSTRQLPVAPWAARPVLVQTQCPAEGRDAVYMLEERLPKACRTFSMLALVHRLGWWWGGSTASYVAAAKPWCSQRPPRAGLWSGWYCSTVASA